MDRQKNIQPNESDFIGRSLTKVERPIEYQGSQT